MNDAWQTVPLQELVTFRGGGTPPTLRPDMWNGQIPWVSPKDMKSDVIMQSIDTITAEAIDCSATSLIPCGASLVVVRSGILARTVPIALAGRELALNQDIKALCPKDNLDPYFLFFFLRSLEQTLLRLVSKGATVHRLATADLKMLEIPVLPLSEQKRIVESLVEALKAVAMARANTEVSVANVNALLSSELQALLSPDGKGWLERPLGELCEVKHGFAFKSEFFTTTGEYVLLTPGNFFESGGYHDRGAKQKYYKGPLLRDYVLKKGDLLVAMTEQAPGLLGSPMIVPESGRFMHNQRLGLVVPKAGIPWVSEFFLQVFNTPMVRAAIYSSGTGVKVRHTSPTKIGDITVSYPPSKAEQEKIAARITRLIDHVERLQSAYRQKLVTLGVLEQALLRAAFKGELRSAKVIAVGAGIT